MLHNYDPQISNYSFKSLEAEINQLTYDEKVPDIEKRILSGYAYTIGYTDNANANPEVTGQKGVFFYITSCKKKGMNNKQIAETILVHAKGGTVPLLEFGKKKN